MTAMINYEDDPRYARIVAKIAAMRPEQRALFDTAIADKAFAGEAMQRYLRGFVDAAAARNRARGLDIKERGIGLRERGLDLQKKYFDLGSGLAQQQRDFGDKQQRLGNIVAAVNVPVSGYFGYKQMKRDIAEADANRSLRELVRQKYGV